MKLKSLIPFVLAFAFLAGCEKPVSETDKNAQIESEVQARLSAEHQTAEAQRLAQQQADLDARERTLADKEQAAPPPPAATPSPRSSEPRDTRLVASMKDDRTHSYDTFYRKLEPEGVWRETDNYGYVFQPRVALQSRNWRPYTDGKWAYTDAGWTWISGEPFGWATYHYGRWTRLRGVGWVWVPGEEWAPAWVSWRTGNEHTGWAPLPPEAHFERKTGIKKWADSYYDIGADEYVFVPNQDIGDDNVEQAVLPASRNVTIVNQTTNVTNITYNNTTIVNEGPNYETLRERSRQPVERLRLEREYNVDQDQRPQSTVRNGVLAIMTPQFTDRATQRPRNVGEKILRATVERATPAANQPDAERAREKMRAEATPPPNAPPKRYQKPEILPGTPAPSATPAATATPTSTIAPTPAATTTPKPTIAPTLVATATPPAATPVPQPTTAPPASMTPRNGRRVPPGRRGMPSIPPTATPPVATPTVAATPIATPTNAPEPVATPAFIPKRAPRPVVTATPVIAPKSPPKPLATPALEPAATPPETEPHLPPKKFAPPVRQLPPKAVPTAAPEATAQPPSDSEAEAKQEARPLVPRPGRALQDRRNPGRLPVMQPTPNVPPAATPKPEPDEAAPAPPVAAGRPGMRGGRLLPVRPSHPGSADEEKPSPTPEGAKEP
ncbi:MAG: DUF6600 domain-containing protein [Chthoniobacterales bacterium]